MVASGVLTERLVVLLILCGIGFVVGRYKEVRKESIANLLIFSITPMVVLHGLIQHPLKQGDFLLPLAGAGLSCTLALITYWALSLASVPRPSRNILACSAGNVNSGYVGLPVAIAVFGEQAAPYAILLSFGFILYENSVGYYLTARGHYSAKDSLWKLLKLPGVYAFALGLTLNKMEFVPAAGLDYLGNLARGAYSVLGMMLLGIAISDIWPREPKRADRPLFRLNFQFMAVALGSKFLVWPIVVLGMLTFLPSSFFDFFPHGKKLLTVFSLLPMAANTVAFATELRAEPEQSALAVLTSTIVSFAIIVSLAS